MNRLLFKLNFRGGDDNSPPGNKFSNLEQKYQRLRQELIIGLFIIVGIFLMGTLWYWLVEDWTLLDAAYMTIITLSSVGFGEVNPLNERSRLFTMIIILTGLIAIGYIVNRFTEAFIQGYFQEGIRIRQKKNRD